MWRLVHFLNIALAILACSGSVAATIPESCVWFIDGVSANKIQTSSNTVGSTGYLGELIHSIAVTSDCAVWAAGKQTLAKFDADGVELIRISLGAINVQCQNDCDDDDLHTDLALNACDDSLWVAGILKIDEQSGDDLACNDTKHFKKGRHDKRLHKKDMRINANTQSASLTNKTSYGVARLSNTGELLSGFYLPARPLKLEASGLGNVWIGMDGSANLRGTDGAILNTVDFGFDEDASVLASDYANGKVWAVSDKHVAAVNLSQLQEQQRFVFDSSIKASARDTTRTAFWFADQSELVEISAGEVASKFNLASLGLPSPQSMEFDALSGQLWFLGREEINSLSADGSIGVPIGVNNKHSYAQIKTRAACDLPN
jgi:hypothetical protein